MDSKVKEYLEGTQGEEPLLQQLLQQVSSREFEEAYGTAMRIQAIRDIKWELLKIDERNK